MVTVYSSTPLPPSPLIPPKPPTNPSSPTCDITLSLSQLSLSSSNPNPIPTPQSSPKKRRKPKKKKLSPMKEREEEKVPGIVTEFKDYFGDESKLENWQQLCRDLEIEPVPMSLTQCRKALRTIWVNIPDFLANKKSGSKQVFFPSERALAKYTLREKKIYPKEWVKEQGPVRELLANIFRGRGFEGRGR